MAPDSHGQERVYFNGVDGTTGRYAVPPAPLAEWSRGLPADPPLGQRGALSPWLDENDLGSVGWAVIFAQGADPAIREALEPLLTWRREQVARGSEARFRIFAGELGYRSGDAEADETEGKPETLERFFARHRIEAGMVDPDQFGYYVLLVGNPEQISFEFQYSLDVQYAVGRLDLDSAEEYARYATSVVEAERTAGRGEAIRPRSVGLWGVENRNDPATRLSRRHLIDPLSQVLNSDSSDWRIETRSGMDATQENLRRMLGGDATPALLLTASHGLSFPSGSPYQRENQGALVTQEWPGPDAPGEPGYRHDHYFSGAHLSPEADVSGLVAFFFACHGAGTPRIDGFAHRYARAARERAPKPFTARLPQRLLAHPRGSALAVIGHVDRAWGHSFFSDLAGPQRKAFRLCLRTLQKGYPVGAALDAFNQRYVSLALQLAGSPASAGEDSQTRSERQRIARWTACQDARSYVILGDPAVRASTTF